MATYWRIVYSLFASLLIWLRFHLPIPRNRSKGEISEIVDEPSSGYSDEPLF
jgi:hypothetical protein